MIFTKIDEAIHEVTQALNTAGYANNESLLQWRTFLFVFTKAKMAVETKNYDKTDPHTQILSNRLLEYWSSAQGEIEEASPEVKNAVLDKLHDELRSLAKSDTASSSFKKSL